MLIGVWSMRHLVTSNPNAISIWIQSCDKKKLKLSHFSKKCCGPEYGVMICSVMEYAQSDTIKNLEVKIQAKQEEKFSLLQRYR